MIYVMYPQTVQELYVQMGVCMHVCLIERSKILTIGE